MPEFQNNVTRMLSKAGIEFEVLQSEPIKRSAIEMAAIYNIPPDEMCKSIVFERLSKGKHLLITIPGPLEVDPRKVAAFIHEKKVKVTTQSEAESLTGMQSGGISPFDLINKGFQFLLHESALDHDLVFISNGQRGVTIRLSPRSYLQVTKAQTGDFAKDDQA